MLCFQVIRNLADADGKAAFHGQCTILQDVLETSAQLLTSLGDVTVRNEAQRDVLHAVVTQ